MKTTATTLITAMLLAPAAFAQGFTSGSDESDGELTYANNLGNVLFEPQTLGLDADGDNVFHFTTITIGSGTNVRLPADTPGLGEGRPVIWLASGAVTITGGIDLNGSVGHHNQGMRLPAVPGAGGFSGGIGSSNAGVSSTPGGGPGGGATASDARGGRAAHSLVPAAIGAASGEVYGSIFLLPLLGGSGGGGGDDPGNNSAGGGAGGGALLIASSTSIALTGAISAQGGGSGAVQFSGTFGGDGSGGAIRLMAPRIDGGGTLDVRGAGSASCGRVRVEGFTISNLLVINPGACSTTSSPGLVFPPANAPTVRVTSVGGIAVPAQTTASFVVPDAVINSAAPVVINLEATNVPVGTQVNLRLTSEDGAGMTLQANALTGTLASSTADTAPITIPSGFSRIFVSASW